MTENEPADEKLGVLEAFDAMRIYLEKFWERGCKESDDIAKLLSMLNRNEALDLLPMDRSVWDDWLNAVKAINARRA